MSEEELPPEIPETVETPVEELPADLFEEPYTSTKSRVFAYQGMSAETAKSLWLISFSDLTALMLAFFVLMYSMSSPREEKWIEMSSSLEQELNDKGEYKGAQWNAGPEQTITLQQMNYGRALDMKYLKTVLSDSLKADKRLEKIRLRTAKGELAIALPADVIFDEKTGRISEEGELSLAALADLLTRIDNRVEIIANVDEGAARRARENGWQAGLNRAALVAAALSAEDYARPLVFYAAAQPDADSADETLIRITPDDGAEQSRGLEFDQSAAP